LLSCVYRLIAPRTFEPVQVEILWDNQGVLVRPTHISICNADQRYYQGTRSERVLGTKLPMSLSHEGIGVVVEDPTGTYKPGSHVVIIPNTPTEKSEFVAENYLPSSKFCGSGSDGLMQEYMILNPSQVIELPESISKDVASFTELVSVAVHAISRFESIAHKSRCTFGVWGDGSVGFIVAILLSLLYPKAKIIVVGRSALKLANFTFVTETHLSEEVTTLPPLDHAFECCGGEGVEIAIDQIISNINPEGTISLLGVSENKVPINTRLILEKGVRIFGSSRSGREDFERVFQLYEKHPVLLDYLRALVENVVEVNTILDIVNAFNLDRRKAMGKTIMHWNI